MDFNTEQVEQLHEQLRHYLGGTICDALGDPTVTDIKCSEDGFVWLVKHKEGWVNTETHIPEYRRISAINVMASLLGRRCNADSPDLSGELPLTGDRVSASVWPSGLPAFFIRRHASEVFSFDDYFAKGILQEWHIKVLLNHIEKRSNIVFSGATGSGKTTLLNTCLSKLNETTEHIVIIEDTQEIKYEGRNFSRFNVADAVTMKQQIKESMRRKPTRLIIGETRDEAGVMLLDAWQTGHRGGFTTVHASSARGVFRRFAQFCQRAGMPPQWDLMESTIDLVVYMEETAEGRRVTELMEVKHDENLDQIPIRLKQIGNNL